MIPTPADTLRTRIRPEWRSISDLVGVLDMIETALAVIGVPKAMKDRVSQNKTLNELGLAQALRGELSKAVIPELRRIRRVAHPHILQRYASHRTPSRQVRM